MKNSPVARHKQPYPELKNDLECEEIEMKMCKLSVKPLALMAMLLVLIAIGGPASANARELRVVGSWSSLTLYNNFEKPFWTDIAPQALGMKVSMTNKPRRT